MDENLPGELVDDLLAANHDAETVIGEGLTGIDDVALVERAKLEERVLLTLDKGIASVLAYPCGSHAGIVLFRPGSAGRSRVTEFVRSRLGDVLQLEIKGHITVVTDQRIRIR